MAVERVIAVDDVCAWPNLTRLPNGEIAAVIFNQPSHGRWEGSVECWITGDEGLSWRLRGTPAPHLPGTNRMNVAAGLAPDGALVVLASGYTPKPRRGEPHTTEQLQILAPWVCRSTDHGATWSQGDAFQLPPGVAAVIPFGDIETAPDGTMAATCYSWDFTGVCSVYFMRSRDRGASWGEGVLLAPGDYNETDILCLGDSRWLAACRTAKDGHLDLFASTDGGGSWTCQGPLTLPRQHPAHLLRLADGRILLTYGMRNRGLYAIGARLSADEGQSWGPPMVLVDLEDASDGGYPSSVQSADGTVVTAYYANRIPSHTRYHMGVVRWPLEP